MAHYSKDVANRILWESRNNPLTPMQLLKLAYLSHGWMLGLHSRPLLQESVEAWQYGPVVPSIYHTYKKFRANQITEIPSQAPTGFTEDEARVINQICDFYGKYTGLQLSALTHKAGSPWDVTRQICGSGAVISNDIIEDYYRTLASRQ